MNSNRTIANSTFLEVDEYKKKRVCVSVCEREREEKKNQILVKWTTTVRKALSNHVACT